ncbi:hypothetical protein EDB89DRAFT_1252624 [Lactarius sanguifluus]|nr:hypothetical protein EDB89DRAFT_1252624 [Lactarius sanguifluus]
MTWRGRPTSNSRSIITNLTCQCYLRALGCHSTRTTCLVKWGKFEEERGKVDKVRDVFQSALELEFFGDEEEQVEKAQSLAPLSERRPV